MNANAEFLKLVATEFTSCWAEDLEDTMGNIQDQMVNLELTDDGLGTGLDYCDHEVFEILSIINSHHIIDVKYAEKQDDKGI